MPSWLDWRVPALHDSFVRNASSSNLSSLSLLKIFSPSFDARTSRTVTSITWKWRSMSCLPYVSNYLWHSTSLHHVVSSRIMAISVAHWQWKSPIPLSSWLKLSLASRCLCISTQSGHVVISYTHANLKDTFWSHLDITHWWRSLYTTLTRKITAWCYRIRALTHSIQGKIIRVLCLDHRERWIFIPQQGLQDHGFIASRPLSRIQVFSSRRG